MFNFDKIIGLTKDKLTQIMNEIEADMIAMAFINYDEMTRNDFLINLDAQKKDEVEKTINLNKFNYTLDKVMKARDYIVDVANELENMGMISLSDDKKDVLNQNDIDQLFGFENTSPARPPRSSFTDQSGIDQLFGSPTNPSAPSSTSTSQDSHGLGLDQSEIDSLLK